MKLIDYAQKMGINYKTAWRWYRAGKLYSTEDLLADLTAIIYRFCARLYGQRRAQRKTEKIVQALEAERAVS